MRFAFLRVVLCSVGIAGCVSLSGPRPARAAPRLVWISLDGLKRQDLVDAGSRLAHPHPHGLRRLLARGHWTGEFLVQNPTITAPSHISTLTCSPPSAHGIFANQVWTGERIQSGFQTPYPVENWAHVLRKGGWKVDPIGYPSLDGTSEGRAASFGFSYDEGKGTARVTSLSPGETRLMTFPSRLMPQSTWKVEVAVSSDGKTLSAHPSTASMQQNALTTRADEGFLHLFFDAGGGRRERVTLLPLRRTASSTDVYSSVTTANQAYPDSFSRALDAEEIIFTPGKDPVLKQAGGDEAFLRGVAARLDVFKRAAKFALTSPLSELQTDVLFLYFEDLDTIGHAFAGDQSKRALVDSYLGQFDQALGEVLELVPEETTNLVVVGDHGMTATRYEINARMLLPVSIREKFVLVPSGGALFLYPGAGVPDAEVSLLGRQAKAALEGVRSSFEPDRHEFNRVVLATDPEARTLGLGPGPGPSLGGPGRVGQVPLVSAFTRPGVSVRSSVENRLLLSMLGTVKDRLALARLSPVARAEVASVKGVPQPLGNHGHFNTEPEMKTSLLLDGPDLSAVDGGKIESTLRLVPAVARALRLPVPKACLEDPLRTE